MHISWIIMLIPRLHISEATKNIFYGIHMEFEIAYRWKNLIFIKVFWDTRQNLDTYVKQFETLLYTRLISKQKLHVA